MSDPRPRPTAKYGFAAMSPEKRAEISRKGGAAQRTRAFSTDSDLAARASRLGVEARARKRAERKASTDER